MADRRGPSLFVRRALIKSFVLDSQCDTTVNTKKKFQTNMFSACRKKEIVVGLLQMCLAGFLWTFLFSVAHVFADGTTHDSRGVLILSLFPAMHNTVFAHNKK